MRKFNIGDQVRVLSFTQDGTIATKHPLVGQIGIVTDIKSRPTSRYPIVVRFLDDTAWRPQEEFTIDELELVHYKTPLPLPG